MTYRSELIEFIKNTEGNLNAQWTEDMTPFSELSAMTEDFITSDSIEGRIASLFIYHQLCIEMMKQLINYCNFYERLCVYPSKLNFKVFTAEASYSEVLNELKFKIEFKHKTKFFQQLKSINDLRNKFGHKLFAQWWEHDMEKDLKKIDNNYIRIFETFKLCLRDIYSRISQAKERPAVLKLLIKSKK